MPGGDAAILSAAFFYSLATVRLGTYARFIPAVELAAAKSVVLGGAAAGMFAVAAVGMAANGDPLTDLWPGYASSPLSWGILVWSALGPGALAAFLHAKVGGQLGERGGGQGLSSAGRYAVGWSIGLAQLLPSLPPSAASSRVKRWCPRLKPRSSSAQFPSGRWPLPFCCWEASP